MQIEGPTLSEIAFRPIHYSTIFYFVISYVTVCSLFLYNKWVCQRKSSNLCPFLSSDLMKYIIKIHHCNIIPSLLLIMAIHSGDWAWSKEHIRSTHAQSSAHSHMISAHILFECDNGIEKKSWMYTYDLSPNWKISVNRRLLLDKSNHLYPTVKSFRTLAPLNLYDHAKKKIYSKFLLKICSSTFAITFTTHVEFIRKNTIPVVVSSTCMRPFVFSMTSSFGFIHRTRVLLCPLQMTICESLT